MWLYEISVLIPHSLCSQHNFLGSHSNIASRIISNYFIHSDIQLFCNILLSLAIIHYFNFPKKSVLLDRTEKFVLFSLELFSCHEPVYIPINL